MNDAVATPAATAKTIIPKYDLYGEVPLVAARRFGSSVGRPRGSVYPVAQMKVGQVFFVPAEEGKSSNEDLAKLAKTVQSSCVRLAKTLKFKLAVRSLPPVGVAENGDSLDPVKNPWGVAGVGVWRVEGEYIYKPRPKAEKPAEGAPEALAAAA